MMLLNRLKTTLPALLLIGALGAGLGLGGAYLPARAGDEPPPPKPAPTRQAQPQASGTTPAARPAPQDPVILPAPQDPLFSVRYVDSGTVDKTGPIPPAPTAGAGPQKAYVLQMQIFEGSPGGKVRVVTPYHRQALSGGKSDTVFISYQERLQDIALNERNFDRAAVGWKQLNGIELQDVALNERNFDLFRGDNRAADLERVKAGISYEVKVRGLGPDRVLLDLTVHKDDAKQADADGVVIVGRSLKIIRQVKIGQLERFAFEKDGQGRPRSWLEVSVILDPGFSPAAEPPPAPRPAEKKAGP